MKNCIKSCINNEPIVHINGFAKDNSRELHGSIYTYIRLFQIFGIDIRHLNHRKTKMSSVFITKCLMRAAWIMVLCLLISETFLKFKFKESSKDLLVISSLVGGSYLMWNYIIKYESNFIEAIKKIEKLEKLLEMSHPEKTIKYCSLLLSTICILSVCTDAYSYDLVSKWVIRNFTIGTRDPDDIHWSIVLFSFIIYQFMAQYGYFFVNYFVSFYVIVCRYMVLIISKHIQMNERIIKRRFTTSNNCDICFIRYDTILALFDTANSILGFPIFLGSSYNACGILLSALNIWTSKNGISMRDICFLLSSFVLFTTTVFAAAAVNEVDKRAKKSNIRVLRSLSNKGRSEIKESIAGLFQMCYSPSFSLTGWDIFDFTKSFYFTAIGCFVTYALLIINL